MMRKSCCIYATGIIATHLLIVGIALMIADVFPGIIIKRLKAEITLTEGSKVFDSWKNPPPPVFMEFFFFNVTNPNEYNSGLAKPRVVEVGPYTYREYRPKENVTFVENGTKVAAYTPKTFVFLREKSVGDPTVDRITTVNVPALAVMNQMQGSFFRAPVAKAWLKMLNITGVLTKLTVDELLWGYEDPLLKKAASLKKVQTSFGFMLDKNGTHDGELVYFTGEKDYLDYGRVDTWKGQRELTYWGSNYSNLIRGSDGSAFHPYLTREETLHIFTPDLCRSIYMNFDKDVEVKGIPAYRFTPPRSVLASAKENPDNAGFCPSPKKGCLGSGVLKVDVCKKDVPIVASFPHFYLGDEEYPNAIDGISPVKEHHQTYVDLNPTTGIMVRASKRAQFNILVEYLSSFPITKGLNTTVFPLFFLNETVVVDDASAARLHKLLLIAKIGSNFPVFIIALGALLVIILLIIIIRLHMKKSEVKRFDFSEAYPYLSTTSKEDTIYSPVNDKTEDYDNSKNGNYVGMTPVKAERA